MLSSFSSLEDGTSSGNLMLSTALSEVSGFISSINIDTGIASPGSSGTLRLTLGSAGVSGDVTWLSGYSTSGKSGGISVTTGNNCVSGTIFSNNNPQQQPQPTNTTTNNPLLLFSATTKPKSKDKLHVNDIDYDDDDAIQNSSSLAIIGSKRKVTTNEKRSNKKKVFIHKRLCY
jgi:hypothetical protein